MVAKEKPRVCIRLSVRAFPFKTIQRKKVVFEGALCFHITSYLSLNTFYCSVLVSLYLFCSKYLYIAHAKNDYPSPFHSIESSIEKNGMLWHAQLRCVPQDRGFNCSKSLRYLNCLFVLPFSRLLSLLIWFPAFSCLCISMLYYSLRHSSEF